MTVEAAKQAFLQSLPVVSGGIRYNEISAMIYRKDRKARKVAITVELLDQCGHSVTITAPDKVELAEA